MQQCLAVCTADAFIQLSLLGSIVLIWPCFVGHNSWPSVQIPTRLRDDVYACTPTPGLRCGAVAGAMGYGRCEFMDSHDAQLHAEVL